MGNYFVILFVAGIVFFGLVKKVNVFDAFISGAKEGFRAAVGIMPSLIALTLCVSILRASGLMEAVSDVFKPFIAELHIPPETFPLMLMRPISGSGALTVLQSIFTSYGPDSRAGNIASVMMGSTETTFYTLTVYFGSVGQKKTGCALPAALTADLTGMIIAALTVNLLMG